MYSLYLDDLRPIPLGYIGVRTFGAFASEIFACGLPNQVSLDHDLGEPNTGLDAMKLLIMFHRTMPIGYPFPRVTIHSANCVGAKDMRALLDDYNRNR